MAGVVVNEETDGAAGTTMVADPRRGSQFSSERDSEAADVMRIELGRG
jgi:hypothetical protein